MGRSGWRLLAAALGLSLVAIVAPGVSTPAGAVSPLPIVCTAAGTLEVVSGPQVSQWKLVGAGSCQGDLDGSYFIPNLLVQGTSDSIGLCGDGEVVVTNLDLKAAGTLVNLANPLKSKTLDGQTWGSPLTTYPITTPFLITSDSGQLGAGTMNSRIFVNCPGAGGSPAMTLQFAFLS